MYYIKYIPSILINGKIFWGNWTAENLLEAICSSLLKKPDVCFSYLGLPGIHTTLNTKTSTKAIILAIIIGSFIISLVIYIICKIQIQRNIDSNLDSSNFGHKINTVVTTYLALKDTNKIQVTDRSD